MFEKKILTDHVNLQDQAKIHIISNKILDCPVMDTGNDRALCGSDEQIELSLSGMKLTWQPTVYRFLDSKVTWQLTVYRFLDSKVT